jgi:hypothetical protein
VVRRAKNKDALTSTWKIKVRRMPKTVEIKEHHSHARSTDAFICPGGGRTRVRVPSVSIVALECHAISHAVLELLY